MPTLPAGIPVDSIVAYAANPNLLPSEWHVCDGTTKTVVDFPELFKTIGYTNGGSDQIFRIPDLQGRFLRGKLPRSQDNTNLSAGLVSPWITGQETKIQVEFTQVPNHRVPVNRGTRTYMVEWHDEGRWFPIRPSSAHVKGDDIPVGTVIPYGGAENVYPEFPDYIRCDGSPTDKDQILDLAKAVRNTFDPSPTPLSFIVPDLRGKFIRGVDLKGASDPVAGSRETALDGSVSELGTWQHYATSFVGNNNLANDDNVNTQTWHSDATETRPINAAVNFYISSVDPVRGLGLKYFQLAVLSLFQERRVHLYLRPLGSLA
ncbi:hypothetical protein ACMFMG_001180 [Clarireedia jacksonii]